MKKQTKAVARCGVVLLGALSIIPFQSARATLVAAGTAVLADSAGDASSPEALTVTYDVNYASGIYTYSYTLNNPAGDVLLPPNSGPEDVHELTLDFNADAPGALIAGSLAGAGTTPEDQGIFGVEWIFNSPILAGSSSSTLSFESDDAPVNGVAGASDANAPSPWSSSPFGSPLDVPSAPDVTSTLSLLSGAMLLMRFGLKKTALGRTHSLWTSRNPS